MPDPPSGEILGNSVRIKIAKFGHFEIRHLTQYSRVLANLTFTPVVSLDISVFVLELPGEPCS